MGGRALVAMAVVWAVAVAHVQGGGRAGVGVGVFRPAEFPTEAPPSPVCMVCHNNLVTPSGVDVSIGTDWRTTMMANSARDPYWQAAVRREVMDHPEAQAEIEDECSICHMPVTTYAARQNGGKGQIFANLPVGQSQAPNAPFAADGVSCAACHQIGAAKLGTPESFTGGYVIDTARPDGTRAMFGPFQTDAGRATLMRSATGFVPTESAHVRSSELCATCHTLFTTPAGRLALGSGRLALGAGPSSALGAGPSAPGSGEGQRSVGRLPEQMPYLEWRHSAYRESATCQSCHMPVVAEPVPVTRVLGQPREDVSRHVFLGGNFFMMRILNRYRAELSVAASPREMEQAIARTIDHLQQATASVAIEPVASTAASEVAFDVVITNRAGHKLPTGYPSRRAWLHVTVRDAAGRVVFESGALRPDGSIAGNDNDADPARVEPHYARITRAEDVQVYESVMVGSDGAPTTGLLTGVRYMKDNRLLPDGFDKTTAPGDVAVHGDASADADFQAGGDRVRYAIDAAGARGPFAIAAELWFQPIGYRWAENLRAYDAPEPRRFVRYWDEMRGMSAVKIAEARASR